MRTVHFGSLALAAVAALTVAASGEAQDRAPGFLNNLEVRQLVARAEPGDQAQLSAHFTALADRYAAEAKRHMSYLGTNIAQASAIHDHLARLARDSAKEATAAAEMHKQLAGVAR